MQNHLITSASILVLVLSVAARAAHAQDSVEDTVNKQSAPVAAREMPIKESKSDDGIRFGNLILKPMLEVFESYDGNIFTEDTNEKSDFVTRISPNLTLKTIDTAHALQFSAGLDQVLFADHDKANYMNYDAGIKDKYKFDKTLSWEGSLNYRKAHSMPGDTDANPAGDAGEALPYNIYTARTSLTKDFGKLNLVPRLGFQRYEYQNVRRNNGLMLDQGYRDRDEKILGGRVGFDIQKEFQIFTDLEYNPRNYLEESATERDSTGGSYVIGTRYRIGKELDLEIAGGFMNRSYDTAAYDDINTYDLSGRASWMVQPGSKVRGSFQRSIVEVTDANTGGAVRNDAKVDFMQDLADDWSGKIGARWINSDYQGGNGATGGTSDREDDYYSANVGVKYELTPVVSFTGDYTYGNNNSNRNTAEYTNNVFMLGVKAGF